MMPIKFWDPDRTYRTGMLVSVGGRFFRAVRRTTGDRPPDSDAWELVSAPERTLKNALGDMYQEPR